MHGIAINPRAVLVPRWRTGGDADSYLDRSYCSWPDLLVDLVGFIISATARAVRADNPIHCGADIRANSDRSLVAASQHKVMPC
jgi:hypothetical protein